MALQIGHRLSIDIDLFSLNSFGESGLFGYLESEKKITLDFISKNTIEGQIADTKVDLTTHGYTLLHELINEEGIRMAGITDIAAVKLNAIAGNGTRLKDFIDIAFLSSSITLSEMIEAYGVKYSSRNPLITLKAINYYADINFDEPIKLIAGKLSWKPIEKRLNQMAKYPNRIFPQMI